MVRKGLAKLWGSRYRVAVIVGAGLLVLIGGVLLVWRPWAGNSSTESSAGIDDSPGAYVSSRSNIEVRFISNDSASKKIKVYNVKTSTEMTYRYTDKTLFVQGIKTLDMPVGSINKGETLYIVYNKQTDIVESVWRP